MKAVITVTHRGSLRSSCLGMVPRRLEVYGTRQALEDEARRWARTPGVVQVWVRLDGKDYEVFQGQLIG